MIYRSYRGQDPIATSDSESSSQRNSSHEWSIRWTAGAVGEFAESY